MNTYHKNPRRISKKQQSDLKRTLKELGDLSCIVHDINSDEIISGNQRSEIFDVNNCEIIINQVYDPATRTGTIAEGYIIHSGERYPYRRVSWTPAQCERANIVANKAGADWDFEILGKDFKVDDLISWGFEDGEVVRKEKPGLIGDDEVPEEVEIVCKTGDLWALGNHRLLCGDSTKKEDVERLMAGEKADMVFTDPPYGVDYDGGHANKKRREKLKGDHSTALYDPICLLAYEHSSDRAPLYLWHAGVKGSKAAAAAAAAAAGYEIRAEIIWNKNLAQFGAIGAQYKQKHEPCYYCFKKGESVNWCSPNNETTVWDCNRSSKNKFHPTQKPVELAVRAIGNHTAEIVLDLFLGSGSTLIACEKTNRKCYGIEIDPHYCDVIIARWEEYTGNKAVKL